MPHPLPTLPETRIATVDLAALEARSSGERTALLGLLASSPAVEAVVVTGAAVFAAAPPEAAELEAWAALPRPWIAGLPEAAGPEALAWALCATHRIAARGGPLVLPAGALPEAADLRRRRLATARSRADAEACGVFDALVAPDEVGDVACLWARVLCDPRQRNRPEEPRAARIRLAEGELLGPFRLAARLGRGAMGEVWGALDPLGRERALKIPTRPGLLRHLRREGVFLARVDHPAVARCYRAELEAAVPYLALELVEGQPLRALCTGTIDGAQAVLLADQILAGLSAIHAAGLVHLDLKPENVIVTPDGRAKIVDLGLGRATAKLMEEVYLSLSLATRQLEAAGTLAYMAPEQRRGEEVDGRTDLFAFGVLLHELLAGVAPHPGRRLSKLRPELPPRWDVAIARLTHPLAAQRPANAAAARRMIAFTQAEKHRRPVADGGREPTDLSSLDELALRAASPFTAGEVIAGHELLEALGRGGFGEVWRARRGEAEVALKLALGAAARPALRSEAEIARQLAGATLPARCAIPALLEDGSEADPPFLVFELVRGVSLRRVLNEEGDQGRQAGEIFARMVDLVGACHAAGVVHGDLKPEHFLVAFTRAGPAVSLIDFGMARHAREDDLDASLLSRAAGGTFDYMAPEMPDAPASFATDVYALGVCLFELLTGELPRGPQRIRHLRPEVPQSTDRFFLRLVHPDPDERLSLPTLRRELPAVLRALKLGRDTRRRRPGVARLEEWVFELRTRASVWLQRLSPLPGIALSVTLAAGLLWWMSWLLGSG